jgi:hypothetical protein
MDSLPELPPALFYGVGAVLIVFGALRAVFLGWKQKPQVLEENPEEAAGAGWSRSAAGAYKRHLTFGALWVAMGLFLVVSTIIKTR